MKLLSEQLLGADQFTNSVTNSNIAVNGDIAVSISGTFVATVTIQRSLDNGSTWNDVSNTAVPVELDLNSRREVLYRVGIKTGDYTSGTVEVKLL